MSNAADISMAQVNTSDLYFMKYSTVSSAAHVHMVVEHPAWYAYWKSLRLKVHPNKIRKTQSNNLRMMLLTDGYTAIVFAGTDTAKLVLDDGDQCSKEKHQSNMAMYKEALDHTRQLLMEYISHSQ